MMAQAKIKQSPKMPAEQRREQLLDAAGTLFLKKGYRGTTTDEVARKAGLTKGGLYFHFKNKEEMLFELVKQMHEDLSGGVANIPPGTASPAQLLEVLLKAKTKVMQADFVSYLDFWVQASKIPKIHAYLQGCMRDYDGVFASRIDPRYAPRKQDRHHLAILIISLYDGLTVRHMLGEGDVDFSQQVKLFRSLTNSRIQKAAETPPKTQETKKAKRTMSKSR